MPRPGTGNAPIQDTCGQAKLMEDAIRARSRLPADRQDALARPILDQIGADR